jgi:eukaryotic-like serine/threonine-protein kinase
MTERNTTAAKSLVGASDVGSLIAGKFRLLELVGAGGQAFIWKAQHLDLDSEVALKILRWSWDDVRQGERLRQEARAVARLNHPAIVRVFDLGQTDQGNPYIVMEHLEGENLADALLRAGRMNPIEAIRLLLPIASGIAAAHAIGVVHRDLKPDNVFLAQSAHVIQPKLLDFGVAKQEANQNRQMKLTEIGAVLGSPSYLSPEQARGQTDIDDRSDIWSFCIMLYECMVGAVPFRAPNTHALLFKIAEDAPSSLMDHGILEPELWQILQRGLEKSPADRWPNMLALGRSLAQWLMDRDIQSDVTGMVLHSLWFNPDIATPVPFSTMRAKSAVSEPPPAPAAFSGEATYVASCPSQALYEAPKRQNRFLGAALGALTLLGAVTALQFGSGRSVHESLASAPSASHDGSQATQSAALLTRLGPGPKRLDFEHQVRANAARLPSQPGALAALPIVPVERLRLVGAEQKHQAAAPSR